MSANQARFLSLTSRQVDLEYRMQQICHRRLRLASELEKIATKYNNALSDRKLFASSNTMYEGISLANLEELGYRVMNNATNTIVQDTLLMGGILAGTSVVPPSETEVYEISSVAELQNALATDANRDGYYILQNDLNLQGTTYNDAFITGLFNGTFDGNGYTISNLDINANGQNAVGFIEALGQGATIKNVALQNSNIVSTNMVGQNFYGTDPTESYAGSLVGVNFGTVENCAVVDPTINASGTSNALTGGAIGRNAGGTVINSYTGISGNTFGTARGAGVFDIVGGLEVGGFIGCNVDYDGNSAVVDNCYSQLNVTSNKNSGDIEMGGFVGDLMAGAAVDNCYAIGTVVYSGSDATPEIGGFVGDAIGVINGSNFWNTETSGMTDGVGTIDPDPANVSGITTSVINGTTYDAGWEALKNDWESTGQWYFPEGGGYPTLSPQGDQIDLEKGLRDGTYCLLREADNYSQETYTIGGTDYEKADWRTVPEIDDDLYTANDTEAETEYEAAIEKINSQDKKLQLEQSQIEVEHKAIITQKDAVKSILNKNIESSFKTFS